MSNGEKTDQFRKILQEAEVKVNVLEQIRQKCIHECLEEKKRGVEQTKITEVLILVLFSSFRL